MKNKFLYSKLIEIEDYENIELKTIFEELAVGDQIKFGLKEVELVPDSRQWESAMAIKSFKDFGLIKPGNKFAGIGAGVEVSTFYLASKDCICFPFDRYLSNTKWSSESPIGMMVDPKRYTTILTDEKNIIPVHSDTRMLKIPSNFFEGVYSIDSIGHLGSLLNVSQSIKEIYRILKPGGIASISTEFRLEGPADKLWFDDDNILFTKELILKNIVEVSGLKLIGELNPDISEKTYETRKELLDYLDSNSKTVSIEDKKSVLPNMVIHHEGYLFCSVHLLLQKPNNVEINNINNNENNYLTTEIENSYSSDIKSLKFIQLKPEIENNVANRKSIISKIYYRFKQIINY